jgi:hypothetical protein
MRPLLPQREKEYAMNPDVLIGFSVLVIVFFSGHSARAANPDLNAYAPD